MSIAIFIISLPRHKERFSRTLDAISTRISEDVTVRVHLVDADDGSAADVFLSNPESVPCVKWSSPHTATHLTRGEYGCGLSHFKAWEKIVRNEAGYSDETVFIVLEDDIEILDSWSFAKIIQTFRSLKTLDFLYLSRKKMTSENEQSLLVADASHYGVTQATFSYWACAYAVTRSGASKLIADGSFSKVVIPVDEYIPFLYRSSPLVEGILQIYPSLANRTLVAGVAEPLLARPVAGAFLVSSTYFSRPVPFVREDVQIFTVASPASHDGVLQLCATAERYGFEVNVISPAEWKGGNMKGPGGGHKITALFEAITSFDDNAIIVFCDGFDVIVNNSANVLFNAFEKFEEKNSGAVLFSSEASCWPDENLAEVYPTPGVFLNSGVFIGRASSVKTLVKKAASRVVSASDDDQRIYTSLFLSADASTPIVLDGERKFAFCLNDIKGESIEGFIDTSACCFVNGKIRPIFVHANGPFVTKMCGNSIANYCAAGRVGCWSSVYGEGVPDKLSHNNLPRIAVAVDTCGEMTSADAEKKALAIIRAASTKEGDYPREKLVGCVLSSKQETTLGLEVICGESEFDKFSALSRWLETARVDKVFYVSSKASITLPATLRLLANVNAKAVAPVLVAGASIRSNFWGAVTETGFYKRSFDYIDIVCGKKLGVFNVPYAWHAILADASLFAEKFTKANYDPERGVDMTWCRNAYEIGGAIIKVLSTPVKVGELFDEPAFPQIANVGEAGSGTRTAWVDAYVDPSFAKTVALGGEIGHAIHHTKMFTEKFCKDLIAHVISFPEKWSATTGDGSKPRYDDRIGNTEAFPTDDCQLEDVGLGPMWKFVVEELIAKAVAKEYTYATRGINLAFVARFSQDAQHSLQYHHDSSTYTVNVCLNSDFEGGGVVFEKSRTSVCLRTPGDTLLHPGRLTHRHASARVTSGTRYILVSFIN
jgi:GR25 family glycosyltransferase involved in LPS biosynthesis